MTKMKSVRSLVFVTLFVWAAQMTFAQVKISGKVLSQTDGSALPGAYVLEKGTTNGTVTDFDGNYSFILQDPDNAILTFTFVGYITKEIAVNGQSVIDITLLEDIEALEEIVITGYSTDSKKLSTASYKTIKSEDFSDKVVSSFQEGLQGLAAGVDVTSASGALGGAVNIRIRGTGSLSSNANPLYVIDGIPYTSYPTDGTGNFGTAFNPLSSINPNDIESQTVLKDAEATAIYGSRGANGVIVIKTKSGQAGKAKYELSYTEGIASATNTIEHLNGPEWLAYIEEGWDNAGTPLNERRLPFVNIEGTEGTFTEDVARSTDIDKYDLVFRTGRQRQASLAVSGGKENYSYRINTTYEKNEGIIEANDLERITFSSNMNYQLNQKLNFKLNLSISNTQNNQYPTNIYFLNNPNVGGGIFQFFSNPTGLNFIRQALPIYPIYNEDGTFFEPTALVNVVPATDDDFFIHQSNNFNSINSANLVYEITPNLKLDSKVGLNYIGYNRQVYLSPFLTTEATNVGCEDCRGYVDNAFQQRFFYNANSVLTYNKEFSNHTLDLLLGGETFWQLNRTITFRGVGFPLTNSLKTIGSASDPFDWDSERSGVLFKSGFFRAKYAYRNKYLAGFSIRADGSSRFGVENRWGTFYSGSLGWLISSEPFMQNSKIVNYLKLRSSYGISGNAEIDQNASFYSWEILESSYGGDQGLRPLRLRESTDFIGWERAESFDLGLDYELFNERISGELAYYNKTNSNLLAKLDLPPSAGLDNFIQNSGVLRNSGVEFSINSLNIDRAFKWRTSFNITFQQNEVKELAVDEQVLAQQNRVAFPQIGGSVASYQMVKWLGVDPATGNELFEDPATGQPYQFIDPERPSKAEMETLIQTIDGKSALPRLTGGLQNSFEYKGFTLSGLFVFKEGFWIYDDELSQMAYLGRGIGVYNMPRFIYEDRWQNPGDVTDVPKVIYDHPFGGAAPDAGSRSTRFLYDGSFIRLRSLSLSYNLPKAWLEKVKMNSARITLSGTNLLTFTKYPGWDPEARNSIAAFSPTENNIAPSVIRGNPPQPRIYKIGVNLTF